MGRPARVYGPGCHGYGLGPRYRHPSTTRARARVVRVFFARIDFESPQRFSKWWITFRLPCPLLSMLSRVSSVFSSWRLQNRTVFHVFSSTAAGHLSSRRLLGLRKTSHQVSHWVGQAGSGMLLNWYVFSFSHSSFFASSSFAAKSLHSHSTLPADGHPPPFPSRAFQAPPIQP